MHVREDAYTENPMRSAATAMKEEEEAVIFAEAYEVDVS